MLDDNRGLFLVVCSPVVFVLFIIPTQLKVHYRKIKRVSLITLNPTSTLQQMRLEVGAKSHVVIRAFARATHVEMRYDQTKQLPL